MSSGPSPRQPKRWPQEAWAAVRKRHRDPSQGTAGSRDLRAEVAELTEKLRSLQDFTFTLTERVSELERMELRRLKGSKAPQFSSKELPPKLVGSPVSTVSMHGSSAPSRGSTTEVMANAM